MGTGPEVAALASGLLCVQQGPVGKRVSVLGGWGVGSKHLGTVNLRYTLESPLCPQLSLLLLSFIHMMSGQVLEGLVKQDDRQRYLEHHHPLAPT